MRITDPDLLTRENITIDTENKTIKFNGPYDDGVSLRALYSFLKEDWKSDSELSKYPFPLISITPQRFLERDDWKINESFNEGDELLVKGTKDYEKEIDILKQKEKKFRDKLAQDMIKKIKHNNLIYLTKIWQLPHTFLNVFKKIKNKK